VSAYSWTRRGERAHEHALQEYGLDTTQVLMAHARMDIIRNWFGCSGKAQAEPAGLS